MNTEQNKLRLALRGVRDAYERGENAMEAARKLLETSENDVVGTLLAYDLQAGSYNAYARTNPDKWTDWCSQIAGHIHPYFNSLAGEGTLLEVGCGEATTMGGVLKLLNNSNINACGFDISWSRIHKGQKWLTELKQNAHLFVADLFKIPFADASIDVVYTSHSLEPNGGREKEAIAECLRVARRAVVFIEPIFELGNEEQQERMRSHGYVRGLKEAAEAIGAVVKKFELLPFAANPLNPSGVMIVEKETLGSSAKPLAWQCPLTGAEMIAEEDVFVVPACGLVYPVLRSIPLLRAEHAVVASKLN